MESRIEGLDAQFFRERADAPQGLVLAAIKFQVVSKEPGTPCSGVQVAETVAGQPPPLLDMHQPAC